MLKFAKLTLLFITIKNNNNDEIYILYFLKCFQEDISNSDMDGKTRTNQPSSSAMPMGDSSSQPIPMGPAGGESTRLFTGNENNF